MAGSESTPDATTTPVPASSPLSAAPASSPAAVDTSVNADASMADEDSEPIRPRTSTRKRKLPARNPTAMNISDNEDDENSEQIATPLPKKKAKAKAAPTSRSVQKRRKAKNPIARGMAIPRCYEECDDADQMLLNWHENGRAWADIRKEWTRRTGERSGSSTLPNRYIRLKSNFTVINEDDHPKLILCKQQVEAEFEAEKWSLIAKAMKARGTEEYGAQTLQVVYKKLILNAENIQLGRDEEDDGDGNDGEDEGE